jgi:hypothetical protein
MEDQNPAGFVSANLYDEFSGHFQGCFSEQAARYYNEVFKEDLTCVWGV